MGWQLQRNAVTPPSGTTTTTTRCTALMPHALATRLNQKFQAIAHGELPPMWPPTPLRGSAVERAAPKTQPTGGGAAQRPPGAHDLHVGASRACGTDCGGGSNGGGHEIHVVVVKPDS